jgi:hypothetical protein
VDWINRYGDLGAIPELDLLKQWWKGEANPPSTEKARVSFVGGKVQLSCLTPGASIGFRKNAKDTWMVYTQPITISKGDSLYIMSHRIGYSPTEMRLKY